MLADHEQLKGLFDTNNRIKERLNAAKSPSEIQSFQLELIKDFGIDPDVARYTMKIFNTIFKTKSTEDVSKNTLKRQAFNTGGYVVAAAFLHISTPKETCSEARSETFRKLSTLTFSPDSYSIIDTISAAQDANSGLNDLADSYAAFSNRAFTPAVETVARISIYCVAHGIEEAWQAFYPELFDSFIAELPNS